MTSAYRRIVIIGPQFGGHDGISELGRQVVRALAVTGGPAVSVHSRGDARCPAALRCEEIDFTGSGGSLVRFAATLVGALLRLDRRDLVVVLHANALPLALVAAARGVTVIPVLVGIESWRHWSWLQRAVLARAHRAIAISSHTAQRFLRANGRSGVPPITICHPAAPQLAVPADPGVPPGYALMVGRLVAAERYKGHDAVLQAWEAVRRAQPDARLVIVGDGDDRPRLEREAARLGVQGAQFLGRIDDARLAGVYGAARFLLMPSRDEGLGLVYLEAMRAGIPCIASPGAAEEIVFDGHTGLIVEHGDAPGIAAACVRLFSDGELCVRLGQAAATRVRRFEFEEFAARLRAAIGTGEAEQC